MSRFSRRIRRIRCISASLALVMLFAVTHPAAVAMSVIHQGEEAALTEVCTVHGVIWVRMEQSSPDMKAGGTAPDLANAGGEDAYFHCPMCFLGDALPVNFERPDLSYAHPGFVLPLSRNEPRPADTAALMVLMAPPRAPPARIGTPDLTPRGCLHGGPVCFWRSFPAPCGPVDGFGHKKTTRRWLFCESEDSIIESWRSGRGSNPRPPA